MKSFEAGQIFQPVDQTTLQSAVALGIFSWAAGVKTEVIRDAFKCIGSPFRIKELEALYPTVSRDMIRVVLNELKDEGLVYAQGRGVAAE